MEDQPKGLAEELVAVAAFATAWMRGGHPPPLDRWQFRAMPGMFAVTVLDDAGKEVPWEGAEQFVHGRGVFWRLPPDASGVLPGLWNKWADGPRRRAHPGGRYPYNTDLLATCKADPRISLLFAIGPPSVRGAQIWTQSSCGLDLGVESPFGPDGKIEPAFRQVPSSIPGLPRYETDLPAPPSLDRLARPGRHRAASWQGAWGGRVWGAIVVSARGYPDLRVLQVALHENWTTEGDVRRAIAESLARTRFWGSSADGHAMICRDDADALILSAVDQLIRQVKRGHHTPAYPIGRSYLRLLIRKDLAALADRSADAQSSLPLDEPGNEEDDQEGDRHLGHGGPLRSGTTSLLDGRPANQPETSPWSDRNLRRVTARLAQNDGHPSLTLLTPEERRGYENRAIDELRERHRLGEMREAIRELLDKRGVTLTPEAIQQFVARHRGEASDELNRSVWAYLARERRPRSG
ncbi:MAG: hypothetical protein ABSA21_04790 [Candidatus Limnocylindrales bacterium]|jgi:hypothetical protein